eukprot:g5549.t1
MFQSFVTNFFSQKLGGSFRRGPALEFESSDEPELCSDTRPDGKLSYGCCLFRGKRATMEDCHDSQFVRSKNGEVVSFFGVFDGHGGCGAARYVRDNLIVNLLDHPKFLTDLEVALKESYILTDKKFLGTSISNRDDGCTAVTAVIVGRKLVVANVGDSRAVLCMNGKAVQLSVDHKPNLVAEKERIENLGGVVCWAGTWRVGGMLAVSRAFGDRPLKKFVVAHPHTTVIEELTSNHEFLILATDGVWDVMTNEEAIQMIQRELDPQKAASCLTEVAANRGSADNISCTVIRFSFTQ